jgi:spermidine synthase
MAQLLTGKELDQRITELTDIGYFRHFANGTEEQKGIAFFRNAHSLAARDDFFVKNGKLYFMEKRNDFEPGFVVKVNKVLYAGKSQYQEHLILSSPEEGHLMVLDGMTMVSDKSEQWYHEFMAHPMYYLHGRAKKALVLGGGDGGMVRELCKHANIERIVQCDIDELVTCLSQKYFPALTIGLSDPRVELVFNDAKIFLDQSKDKFDLVAYDLCDPDVGPTEGMFENEIFQKTRDRMTENGILVMQAESPIHNREWIKDTMKELKNYFPTVACYQFPMPIYPNGLWCAVLASNKKLSDQEIIYPYDLYVSVIARAGQVDIPVQHYDAHAHQASFLALKSWWGKE